MEPKEPLKVNRLSPYVRERILTLRDNGFSIVDTRRELLKQENIQVTRHAIGKFLKRFSNTGVIHDVGNFSKQGILQQEHLDFIDQTIYGDREISAREVTNLLIIRYDLTVSSTTIKRARQNLGWIHSPTQYCQQVRDINKMKRLDFAIRCATDRDTFDDAIFTDETTVKIQTSTQFHFRKRGESLPPKGQPKHPYQVHVWGGISRRGATGLYIFTGIMDSIFYQSILSNKLVPFVQTTYPNDHRFIQDNDPKHVSLSTRNWMQQNNIHHWPTPPESPDMNPIENIWAAMKHHIRRVKKPTSQQELIDGINEFWETVTPEMCSKYIDHLYKVIPTVIEIEGCASGY